MADTRKLTMVFTLDNGDDFKYNLADPKDELTKERNPQQAAEAGGHPPQRPERQAS